MLAGANVSAASGAAASSSSPTRIHPARLALPPIAVLCNRLVPLALICGVEVIPVIRPEQPVEWHGARCLLRVEFKMREMPLRRHAKRETAAPRGTVERGNAWLLVPTVVPSPCWARGADCSTPPYIGTPLPGLPAILCL
jgi:hypothetical protein